MSSSGNIFEPQYQQSRPDLIKTSPGEQSEVTWKVIVAMLVISSVILVVLYFFIDSILLFLKIILIFSSFVATAFTVWDWFWSLIPHKITNIIITVAFSAGTALIWFFTEHWLVTNLITFCICVAGITFIKITSFKICLLVAICFIIYDVWWVFLSPLVFGESVMVEAATSASSHIPAAFAAPRGDHNALIGAGDVVIPGIVLDFFLRYDQKKDTRYFEVSFGCYILGVALSWIMVSVMNHGQPALLWIFPSVLIPTVSIAACKGALKDMWKNGTNPSTEVSTNRSQYEEINDQLLDENNDNYHKKYDEYITE
ncbi:signal peptide peptidase-like 3 [Histomonas meleagridis]|uniref:signal peptide peptidase-like 3 n=1 Tax=Histomonas meleagridis TaxID=135588 RepID=UPI003559B0CA|nr:signal peptide peptidase-like 3 [Histomonas meleagridis]KAH0798307.1 signal peptide peptidase-like 3 [Histomonas meleagridis]